MFGPKGGNKAMITVARGYLIDYVVREVEALSPTRTLVLVTRDDATTPARVRELTASQVDVISSPSDGTGPGVRRLLLAATTELIALTTCDLAASAGSLTTFFHGAIPLTDHTGPRCVIATSPLDHADPAPIYVHTRDDEVVEYGKSAPRSELSFAGARIMNSAFASLLLNVPERFATDTQMMTSVMRQHPGTIRAIKVDDLFDVDNAQALLRAKALTSGDPSGQHLP